LPGDRGVSGCGGEALTWVPHPHSPGADAGDSAWAHASLALPFSLCGETLRWLLRRPRQAKVEGVRFWTVGSGLFAANLDGASLR
jgi:hypothetical protein